MIRYKFDVFEALRSKGITTTRANRFNDIPFQAKTLLNIKSNTNISITTVNKICIILGLQPGEVIEEIVTDEEKTEYEKFIAYDTTCDETTSSSPDIKENEAADTTTEPETDKKTENVMHDEVKTMDTATSNDSCADVLSIDESKAYGEIYATLSKNIEGWQSPDRMKQALVRPGAVLIDYIKNAMINGEEINKPLVLEQFSKVNTDHINYVLTDEGKVEFTLAFISNS